MAANQIGKTVFTACLILWACLYKVGEPPIARHPGGPRGWLAQSYLWLHLGPVQQQAYLALADARMLIKNEHPAQAGRGRLPKGLVEEAKVEKYYDGLVFWNGAEAQFRTAEERAKAILGHRAAGISVDEAAFVEHLAETVNTVLYMRLIASNGPLFLISTPNGMNDFYDFVDGAKAGGEMVDDLTWRRVDPETHTFQVVIHAVVTDNLGYGLTQAAIDVMEVTLSPATREQQLRGAFLEPAEAYFVPIDRILECFRHDMPEEQAPVPGHTYAIFWDPSASGASDPTAVIVLDITDLPWQGVYWRWYQRAMGITPLVGAIHQLHSAYHGYREERNPLAAPSRAVTGFDATAMGGVIVKQLLSKVHPQRPINFGGGSTKVPSLINLRNLLTRGHIELPAAWRQLRQEVVNYRLKDDAIRQDNVMALMGVSIVATNMTNSGKYMKADVGARTTPQKRRLVWR